jgi:hypothetical protein
MKRKIVTSGSEENKDNLGLDADRSSEGASPYDGDNDVISHNPDGEDDDNDDEQPLGDSPLMSK